MNFLKSPLLLARAVIPFLHVALYAETRTFTNKSGKQFTGEVKGISALRRNPNYSVRISVFPQKGKPKLTFNQILATSGRERLRRFLDMVALVPSE